MTDDLIPFVRARLDETQRIARAAGWDHPVWSYDRETFTVSSDAYVIAARKDLVSPINDVDGEHIAANDPAHVLRQVEALRRLVDMAAAELRLLDVLPTDRHPPDARAIRERNMFTSRILASVWSDHPEFRTEWEA